MGRLTSSLWRFSLTLLVGELVACSDKSKTGLRERRKNMAMDGGVKDEYIEE